MRENNIKNQSKKNIKWTVYALTFITYALYHAVRAAWAGMKTMLKEQPFSFSIDFLGFLDMIALFTMAVSLTIFGHRVQKFGAKKCLIIGMSLLSILTFFVSILVLKGVNSRILYVIFFGLLIGLVSATGWPSCLYILSQYFDKKNNTALPIFNGCIQFGDFIALFISDIVLQATHSNPSIVLITISVLILITLVSNVILLPGDRIKSNIEEIIMDKHQLNEQLSQNKQKKNRNSNKLKYESNKPLNSIKQDFQQVKTNKIVRQQGKQPIQIQIKQQIFQTKNSQIQSKNIENLINEKDLISMQKNQQIVNGNQQLFTVGSKSDNASQTNSNKPCVLPSPQKMPQVSLQITQTDTTPVDFTNVWCLPGVALYVVSYAIIKSVNTLIMVWLVYYLSMPQIDMKDESRVIAILWTVGVFGGGVIGGKVNGEYSKKKFMIFLGISAIMFLTLQRMHQNIYEMQIALAIIICSLSYGIPYNMFSTAIPIMLGQKQQVKNRPGAKSAIISLMQGFGIGVAALSILMVPLIGVNNIHLVLMVYCLVALSIIGYSLHSQTPNRCVQSQSQSERQQNNSDQKC